MPAFAPGKLFEETVAPSSYFFQLGQVEVSYLRSDEVRSLWF
ncbi:hypothetical protein [Chroococcidiopsis sp. SAG 2025]|nr:hypothetical protein [Chroococcidiopsis sp. SAG 2025]